MTEKESSGNIRSLCATHAPKPISYDGDPAALIGRFVKLGFPTGPLPAGTPPERWPTYEHMWVKVVRVDGDTLTGVLDNEPAYAALKLGQEIAFAANEIEDIHAEGSA